MLNVESVLFNNDRPNEHKIFSYYLVGGQIMARFHLLTAPEEKLSSSWCVQHLNKKEK